MKSLILHPTDMSQWHAIVGEAQAHTQIMLAEDTESYLVFLLMRFSKYQQLMESIIALDFLGSLEAVGQNQVERLQEVGDKSLMFCGLFPGIANKRRVNIEYFSDVGQTAYLTAAAHHEHPHALLFGRLSEQFLILQQVLQALHSEQETEPLLAKPVGIANS
jgi:hypothetical protein